MKNIIKTEMGELINGDCIEEIKNIESNSIDFSIFSPPFAELYVFSDDIRDMANCSNHNEFLTHFSYLLPQLYRIIKSGRLVAIHTMDLPIMKGKEGYLGLRDFSGMLIDAMQKAGFIYHSRITIWKNPAVEMQRTKSIGLLHKQLKKDSSISRAGIPDYLLVFRKDGINATPITQDIDVATWQKLASPIWMDINQTKTLNTIKHEKDEKHICPLQLDTIKKAVMLWTNEGETVFSPFAGIGSEGYQSILMNRKFIGIELKKEYYNQMVTNIKNAELSIKQKTIFDFIDLDNETADLPNNNL